MNLANKLTLSRIIITFFFMGFILCDGLACHLCALLLVVIAMLTDAFDGKIARQRNLVTDLGKLMDPLSDKILIAAAFISFVELGLVPAWMVVVIISREFIITGLRLIASLKGTIISASRVGQHKTISQMVVIILIIVLIIVRDILLKFIALDIGVMNMVEYWFNFVVLVSMLITVTLTVVSGYMYLKKNIGLFKE